MEITLLNASIFVMLILIAYLVWSVHNLNSDMDELINKHNSFLDMIFNSVEENEDE